MTLQVQGLPLVRQWYLISRADRELSTAASVLRSFILEHRDGVLPS